MEEDKKTQSTWITATSELEKAMKLWDADVEIAQIPEGTPIIQKPVHPQTYEIRNLLKELQQKLDELSQKK